MTAVHESTLSHIVVFYFLAKFGFFLTNKQLLDEAEYDVKNYPDRGQCYLPKPKAEADNIERSLNNS